MELKPLNILVSQIEPGLLKSPMMDKRQVVAERIGDYELWRQRAFRPFGMPRRRGCARSGSRRPCRRSWPARPHGYAI
jgi:hypothetical protein